MTRVDWAIVFAFASVLAMLADALRDHAREHVVGKPKDEEEEE